MLEKIFTVFSPLTIFPKWARGKPLGRRNFERLASLVGGRQGSKVPRVFANRSQAGAMAIDMDSSARTSLSDLAAKEFQLMTEEEFQV